MIIIADSGSTKTSWCFMDKNQNTTFYTTSGINPFFRSSEDIEAELRQKLPVEFRDKPESIFFYGAGIINEEKGNIVKRALKNLFPQAKTEVNSDLLAAAHATLGKSSGIACILGTGSNSCFYDGNTITEHIPPLGFILGDEGSGAVLGQKLLADFLKGIMPIHLSEKFKIQFPMDYPEFMEKVYRNEKPNQFLAGFVPFLQENIHDEYCLQTLEDSFEEFVKRNILRYSQFRDVPITFVGSVAFYFREQLVNVLEKNNLQPGRIVKEPLEGLITLYTKNKL